jgi:hypothetical protein
VTSLRQNSRNTSRSPGACAAPRNNARQEVINRRGENTGTHFRSSRYFAVGHEWYAATREGSMVGPFADQHEAELGLAWHLVQKTNDTVAIIEELDTATDRTVTSFEVLLLEFHTCQRESGLRPGSRVFAWAKQRLDDFEHGTAEPDAVPVRAQVLRHFLQELDQLPAQMSDDFGGLASYS